MNFRSVLGRVPVLACLLCSLMVATVALAAPQPTNITPAFSGVWDQPDHRSQGFILNIAESPEGEMLGVAYWFTYGPDLMSAWYVAVGPIVDDRIEMTLYEAAGIGFLDSPGGEEPDVESLGTMTMWFKNCQHGYVNWESDDEMLGSGEIRIKRLTKIYRMDCAQRDRDKDDDDDGDEEEGLEFEISLDNTGVIEGAEGEAEYEEEGDEREFEVEIEGVGPGSYPVHVADTERGVIVVEEGEEDGKLKFSDPEKDDALPLDFDLPGQSVKVYFDGEVILEGAFPDA